MATSKLLLYRGACDVLGERKIQSLIEDVPLRKTLDGIWQRDGVERCLQEGLWNFATRGVQLDADPSYTASFGHTYSFALPDDYVRLVAISHSETYKPALRNYHMDARRIYSDHEVLYLRYVSKHSTWGLNFELWPPNFTAFVETDFGWRACRRTTGSGRTKAEIGEDRMAALAKARSTDAAEESTEIQPSGAWGQARGRRGRYYSTRGTPLF